MLCQPRNYDQKCVRIQTLRFFVFHQKQLVSHFSFVFVLGKTSHASIVRACGCILPSIVVFAFAICQCRFCFVSVCTGYANEHSSAGRRTNDTLEIYLIVVWKNERMGEWVMGIGVGMGSLSQLTSHQKRATSNLLLGKKFSVRSRVAICTWNWNQFIWNHKIRHQHSHVINCCAKKKNDGSITFMYIVQPAIGIINLQSTIHLLGQSNASSFINQRPLLQKNCFIREIYAAQCMGKFS